MILRSRTKICLLEENPISPNSYKIHRKKKHTNKMSLSKKPFLDCPNTPSKLPLQESMQNISEHAVAEGYPSPEVNAMKAYSLMTSTAHKLLNSTPVKLHSRSVDRSASGPLSLLSTNCEAIESGKEQLAILSADRGRHSLATSYKLKFKQHDVTICRNIYKSGKQVCLIPSLKTYSKISLKIKEYQKKLFLSDSQIAKICFDILHSDEIKDLKDIAPAKRDEIVKYLSSVCALLFSAEAERSKSVLMTHAMFLELVIAGKYKFSDITKLPIAFKGAMGGVRVLDGLLASQISKYMKYDYSEEAAYADEQTISEILLRNLEITRDWFLLKGIDITSGALNGPMLRAVVDLLRQSISAWYSVDLKFYHTADADQDIWPVPFIMPEEDPHLLGEPSSLDE